MQRDIKFRIWDGSKIHYDALVQTSMKWHPLRDKVECSLKAYPFEGIESGEFFYGNEIENAVIMQYIGLSDSEGNNIYEGDILKSAHSKYTYKVEWQITSASFRLRIAEYELRNTVVEITNSKAYTIIGNAYLNA